MTPSPAEIARAAGLDPQRLPAHVAVIMDGNGRWAQGKGWERLLGHRRGAEAVRAVTTAAAQLTLPRLTLYAFSSENWKRPAAEVAALMRLLADYLDGELPTLMANRVRLAAIGDLDRLPDSVRSRLAAARAATAANAGTVLCLALSYGGREELARACARIAASGIAPAAIDERTVAAHLDDPAGGEVDLVIRTAGEQRLSNFLPWQTTYAEYVSTPVLWPDFAADAFHDCLREFQRRRRTFGAV